MGSLRLNGEKDADYYAPVAFASYCLPPLVTKKCFTFGYKGMLWFMLGWLKQKTNSLNNQDGYEISAYDKEFENSYLKLTLCYNWGISTVGLCKRCISNFPWLGYLGGTDIWCCCGF